MFAAVISGERNIVVQSVGQPYLHRIQRANPRRRLVCVVSDFGIAHRQRDVHGGTGRVGVAAVGVHAAWHIYGDYPQVVTLRLRRHEHIQNIPNRACERSDAPDTENGVNYDMRRIQQCAQPRQSRVVGRRDDGNIERVHDVELGVGGTPVAADVGGNSRSPVMEVARYDKPVAAVVAGADQHDYRRSEEGGTQSPDVARGLKPGALHESVLGHARRFGAVFDLAHPVGGYDFHIQQPYGFPLARE